MPDIAPLTPADIPAAAALWAAAGLTRPWNDPVADAERALAGPASTILAARNETALIGTIMTGHDGHRGWVYYLAVAETARRSGIGRALMAAAEAWCAAHGITRLNLTVRTDNAAAHGFYARLGYRAADVVVLQRDVA